MDLYLLAKRFQNEIERNGAVTEKMSIDQAIYHMGENRGLKMTMANHWRSREYVFCDSNGVFVTETGEVWDIGLSRAYNEIDGYSDWRDASK
jgi:hypothetical protein